MAEPTGSCDVPAPRPPAGRGSRVVRFLAGPGARYITGQTIVIDGGYSLV